MGTVIAIQALSTPVDHTANYVLWGITLLCLALTAYGKTCR